MSSKGGWGPRYSYVSGPNKGGQWGACIHILRGWSLLLNNWKNPLFYAIVFSNFLSQTYSHFSCFPFFYPNKNRQSAGKVEVMGSKEGSKYVTKALLRRQFCRAKIHHFTRAQMFPLFSFFWTYCRLKPPVLYVFVGENHQLAWMFLLTVVNASFLTGLALNGCVRGGFRDPALSCVCGKKRRHRRHHQWGGCIFMCFFVKTGIYSHKSLVFPRTCNKFFVWKKFTST